MRSRLLLAVLVIVAISALTACSSATDEGHSQADVTYLQTVVASEGRSEQIGGLLRASASAQDVQDLGAAIAKSQGRYADRATALLADWGVTVPDVGVDAEVTTLAQTSGASVDKGALELLLQRHEAIIGASTTESTTGENSARLAHSLTRRPKMELAKSTRRRSRKNRANV
jgi:hypothetical protein